MNKKKLASNLMLAGGVVELLIALLHFLWPPQLLRTGEYAGLSTDYRNLLVLFCVAVGLCLTVFGALSIYYARALVTGDRTAWIFGVIQGGWWESRAILEVVFPVKITLLIVPNPTVMILPLTIVLGLMFLIPLLAFHEEFAKT